MKIKLMLLNSKRGWCMGSMVRLKNTQIKNNVFLECHVRWKLWRVVVTRAKVKYCTYERHKYVETLFCLCTFRKVVGELIA